MGKFRKRGYIASVKFYSQLPKNCIFTERERNVQRVFSCSNFFKKRCAAVGKLQPKNNSHGDHLKKRCNPVMENV